MIYNFSAGPSPLPGWVRDKLAEDLRRSDGDSLIETNYVEKPVQDLIKKTTDLFREVAEVPNTHEIIWVSGSARLLFSAIPMNLASLTGTPLFVDSGQFSSLASREAARYTRIDFIASSSKDNYRRVPDVPRSFDGKYIHLAYNNTTNGTAFQQLPKTRKPFLVVDCTSDLLSREFDYSKVGIMFAGVQKNLGPAGLTVVVIRKDLLDYAWPFTPEQLNFKEIAEGNSSICTPNVFSMLGCKYALEWIKIQGGVEAIEKMNRKKADLIYDVIDGSSLYEGHADRDCRSIINICFHVKDDQLENFLREAAACGLTHLRGYRTIGGVRASMYNAMPIDGAMALASFMKYFEEKYKKDLDDAKTIGYY